MLKRFTMPDCPLEIAMTVMSGRWKGLIVHDLLAGPKRFGELAESLTGISHKVLADHLRIMEEYGLIRRKVYAEMPPKVEYSLTELGQRLKSIHNAMWQWGEEYQQKTGGAQITAGLAAGLLQMRAEGIPAVYRCQEALYKGERPPFTQSSPLEK